MVQLALNQATKRFQENDERMDGFVNGDENGGYTSSNGKAVPSIQKFLAKKDAEINADAGGILSQATDARDLAEASAIDASNTAASIASQSALLDALPTGAGSNRIGFQQAGANSIEQTSQDKLREIVSVKDFNGADPTGVISSVGAFRSAAVSAGNGYCIVPPGSWLLNDFVSYPCQFVVMKGASIAGIEYITGQIVDLADRDYEALMGLGYFNIWLDGNSFSNPISGSFAATLARILYDGSAGSFIVDQAGGPFSVGASNGLRWNQTAAGSGDTYRMLEWRIEDASAYNNGKATLSFFVTAGSGSPLIKAEVVQFFGSGGSPSSDTICGSVTFNASTSIRRKVLTVDMPSTATKTFGTNMDDCVKVRIYLPNNAIFNVVLNELKFERGPIRTDFVQYPLSLQHSYIDRYLQYSTVSIGFTATAAGQYSYASIPFKQEMRKIPAITWSTLSGHTEANLDASLAGHPAATYIQKFGATAFTFSAAAGACLALGQVAKMDARL